MQKSMNYLFGGQMETLILSLVHFNREPNTEHVRKIIAKMKGVLERELEIVTIEFYIAAR